MKRRFLKLFVFSLAVAFPLLAHSQIQSKGTLPVIDNSGSTDVVEMPTYAAPKLSAAFSRDLLQHKTLHFAHPFQVDLTPDNAGTWTTDTQGNQVWQLAIKSSGAKSIGLIFKRFKLKDGDKLYVYNKDKSVIRGAFTALNNKASGKLPIMPVNGDELIIEFVPANNQIKNIDLSLGTVTHDYIGIFDKAISAGYFGDSGDCEINVACNSAIQDFKRAIVKIIIDGTELCTGALINNTAQDGKNYVLTAGHSYNDAGFDGSTSLFIFNYESPACDLADVEGTREQSVAGGIMRAMAPKTSEEDIDFALLELSVSPPDYYMPLYLGWDATGESSDNLSCIHHPMGDVKKISTFEDTPTQTWLVLGDKKFYENAHWLVSRWTTGTTEGGSSGSPILTADGKIIGGLSAGLASCSNPIIDYFFRFDLAWNTYSDPSENLKSWLDPNSTGALSLGTLDPISKSGLQRYNNISSTEASFSGILTPGSVGYYTGHNSFSVNEYAEKFTNSGATELYGMFICPSRFTRSDNSKILLRIWKGDNLPTQLVHEQELQVTEWGSQQKVTTSNYGSTGGFSSKSYLQGKETFVLFPDTVVLDGNFFVGYEIEYLSTVDTFAVYAALANENSAYFKTNSIWKPFSNFLFQSKPLSLWINPVGKPTTSNSLSELQHDSQIQLYPNPASKSQGVEVVIGENSPKIMQIFSLSGTLMYENNNLKSNSITTINLSSFTPGAYVCVLKYSDNSTEIEKLIIQ